MKVTILGCGPAGLVAAKAVLDRGHDVTILSQSISPSEQYGCQYLHAPIPGYEDVASVRVSYRLNGDPDAYRYKVYGSAWEGKVSPEDFIGEHTAWDIRQTYSLLWSDLIGSRNVRTREARATSGVISGLYLDEPDLIFSSIPAPALCYNRNHFFRSHEIWANGSMLAGDLADNSVICDGTPEHDWYRISNVFGFRTTEWPHKPHAKYRKAVPVAKPLATNCDCYPDVHRVGRYGTWHKGYLVHEVYPAVAGTLIDPDIIRGIEWVTGETYGKWQM